MNDTILIKMSQKLSKNEIKKLLSISEELDIDPNVLYSLLDFESGFNPKIKNPQSSARGIMQWIDARAKDLGFSDSLDLVEKNPTISDQLDIVRKDFKRFGKFEDRQALYMALFYPKYMRVPPSTEFPPNVQAVNKPIKTVQDYINFVDKKLGLPPEEKKNSLALALIVGVGLLLLLQNKKR